TGPDLVRLVWVTLLSSGVRSISRLVPVGVPSLSKSAYPWMSPSVASNSTLPLTSTSRPKPLEYGPGKTSLTKTVPVSVPSFLQRSKPCLGSRPQNRGLRRCSAFAADHQIHQRPRHARARP